MARTSLIAAVAAALALAAPGAALAQDDLSGYSTTTPTTPEQTTPATPTETTGTYTTPVQTTPATQVAGESDELPEGAADGAVQGDTAEGAADDPVTAVAGASDTAAKPALAAQQGPAELAFTGADERPYLALGALLLLAGVALVVVPRRRGAGR
jgi:hypothetical protein